MKNERRIFGPPGTGKTTRLKKEVTTAAKHFGSRKVFIASFTRTAAAELVSRNLPVERQQIGTLHRHAYDSLGRPDMVNVEEWNETYPQLEITRAVAGDPDDIGATEQVKATTKGDELMQQLQMARARMVPKDRWSGPLLSFAEKWDDFKKATKAIDFTDMIDMAYQETDAAPGEPDIGIFDETQDFTPLELALVRKWGEKMKLYILAGDDDQAIYSFKGADPNAFLNPQLPDNQVITLPQSYRVPKKVQAYAERWVKQIKKRHPKEYRPRDAEGQLQRLPQATIRRPEAAVHDAMKRIEEGKTVMFLTSCAHMLRPLMKVLRREGLIYHNPYKQERGDWNPVTPFRGPAKRLLDFLRPDSDVWGEHARLWTPEELRNWVKVMKAKGVIRHGMKKKLDPKYLDSEDPVAVSFCEQLFEDKAWLEIATRKGPEWFEAHLLQSKRKSHEYVLDIAKKYGARRLMKEPDVIVGTIHSVKGGQADVVYLFPDLSPAGMKEWTRNRDGIIRSYYVGMTRCKETLVLCGQASPNAVRI